MSSVKVGACTTIPGYSGAVRLECSGSSAVVQGWDTSTTCSGSADSSPSVLSSDVGVCKTGEQTSLGIKFALSNLTTCTSSASTTTLATAALLLVALLCIASGYAF